jgi:hypothetical protein
MHRFRKLRSPSYAEVMSTVAVVVALAGGSTAVAISASGKNADVNKKGNIRAARVTEAKIADSNVTAAKLAGIDRVQVTGQGTALATCPSGERLIGGGGALSGGPQQFDTSLPEGNGWRVGPQFGGGSSTATSIALCLRANP